VIDECLASSSLPSIAEADGEGIDAYEIEDRLKMNNDLVDHLVVNAERLSRLFGGSPLLMRSSGRGDAIGVGVYDSALHGVDPKSICEAFSRVAASYFKTGGIVYRGRAGLASGFGMFIQPLVGNKLDGISTYKRGGKKDTAILYEAPFSGNAKLGTTKSPYGAMKLQGGLGGAVAIPGLPVFEFQDDEEDGEGVDSAATERIIFGTSHRNKRADDAVIGTGYVFEELYGWRKNYDREYYPARNGREILHLTIGSLKEILTRAHGALGGTPTYLEFVAREEEGQERIYVVQKGNIAQARAGEISLDAVPGEKVLWKNMTVEAGNGSSPKFDTIVCLIGEDKSDLYEFDKTDEAQGGYMIAFDAQSSPRSNRIQIRQLKHVKAVVTLESMGYSHSGSPEDHLAGYSDTLGIPLMSIISQSNEAWMLFSGFSWDGENKGSKQGTLIIRKGSFQVVADQFSSDGVILDFNK